MKTIEKIKKEIKSITKEEIVLGCAIGIPTGVSIILIAREAAVQKVCKAIAVQLVETGVYEKVLSDGSLMRTTLTKAGETVAEVCACAH